MKTKKMFAVLLTMVMAFTMMGSLAVNAASVNLNPSPALWNSGADVQQIKYLQMNLNGLNFKVGTVDGKYGDYKTSNTGKAVKNYQISKGTAVVGTADGMAGTKTLTALVNDVKAVQNNLIKHGYNPGTVDGIFGSTTEKAVMDFQRDKKLSLVDGVVGSVTASELAKPKTSPNTYTFTVDTTGTYTFPAANTGYGTQTARTVTVKNTGNQSGSFTITTSSANFTLNKSTTGVLAAGVSTTFTVVPKTGLEVGTYTSTITVNGGSNFGSKAFAVSFTVKPKGFKYNSPKVEKYSLKTDGEKYLSTNFQVKEFAPHKCNLAKCPGSDFDTIYIDLALVERLQAIRENFKKAVTITSGYRTQEHNDHLKGASLGSYHLKGQAADIKISGVSRDEIRTYANKIGLSCEIYTDDRKDTPGLDQHVDTRNISSPKNFNQ